MIKLSNLKSAPFWLSIFRRARTFLSLMFVISLSISCSMQVEETKESKLTEREKYERMIDQNRAVLDAERQAIRSYMDSSSQKFIRNGLGMHISVIERGSGNILDTGDLVQVHSRITDLKGYEFNQSEHSQFSILRDSEMIWGVQEASLGSRQGDSLILIIPAHLAHGLVGDLNTIPPLTTLVYYLRIL